MEDPINLIKKKLQEANRVKATKINFTIGEIDNILFYLINKNDEIIKLQKSLLNNKNDDVVTISINPKL